MHNRIYIAQEHIEWGKDADKLIEKVRAALADPAVLDTELEKQHGAALAESADSYRRFFGFCL